MHLIGIEEHFLTPEVAQAWQDIGLAAHDPSVAFHGGPIEGRLTSLAEERLALMDETGLDVQVLSLTTPALHDLGDDSVDLARRTNDALAAAIARHPTRFQGFATLPVACPDEAALELERCVRDLGFKGTMLCGRVGTRNLDHPSLAPMFESAARLRAPILLHPECRRRRCARPIIQGWAHSSISFSPDRAWAGIMTPGSSSCGWCCRERLTASPICR
jgi:predicted TIM-barrel fold metal-dependent hydrolase